VVEAAYLDERMLVVLLLQIVSVGTFLSTGLKLPYAAFVGTHGFGPRTNHEGHPIHVTPVPVTMYVAMGTVALLNLAIGLFPDLLYDLLPFGVDYQAYSLGKVLEKTQILVFTGLGFWLVLHKLGAKSMIILDTDWLYRRLPQAIVGLARAGRTDRAPVERDARPTPEPVATAQRARTAVLERLGGGDPDSPPPVSATWTLGAIIMGVAVLLLGVSLW